MMGKGYPTVMIGTWECIEPAVQTVVAAIKSTLMDETCLTDESNALLAEKILLRLFECNTRADLRWLLDTQVNTEDDY